MQQPACRILIQQAGVLSNTPTAALKNELTPKVALAFTMKRSAAPPHFHLPGRRKVRHENQGERWRSLLPGPLIKSDASQSW